jgi:T-complex protein 1 subunit eta
MARVVKATGGVIQSTLNNIAEDALGVCGIFEEVQIGAERFNLFKECPNAKTATIIIRGGAEQFVKEAERSLNDAIMIVRRAVKASKIVAGAGAVELELSRYLRHHARTISGKLQLVVNSFAKALEVIPRNISDNAGLDSLEVLNKLRQKHANDGRWYGVDINSNTGILDAYDAFIWEPLIIKVNALSSACEAACIILSIDETVKNPKSDQDSKMKQPMRMPPMKGLPGLKRMK